MTESTTLSALDLRCKAAYYQWVTSFVEDKRDLFDLINQHLPEYKEGKIGVTTITEILRNEADKRVSPTLREMTDVIYESQPRFWWRTAKAAFLFGSASIVGLMSVGYPALHMYSTWHMPSAIEKGRDIDVATSNVTNLRSDILQLNNTLNTQSSAVMWYDDNINTYSFDKQTAETNVHAWQAKLETLNAEIRETVDKRKYSNADEREDALRREINKRAQDELTINMKLRTYESDFTLAKSNLDASESKLRQAKRDRTSTEEQLAAAQKTLASAQETLTALKTPSPPFVFLDWLVNSFLGQIMLAFQTLAVVANVFYNRQKLARQKAEYVTKRRNITLGMALALEQKVKTELKDTLILSDLMTTVIRSAPKTPDLRVFSQTSSDLIRRLGISDDARTRLLNLMRLTYSQHMAGDTAFMGPSESARLAQPLTTELSALNNADREAILNAFGTGHFAADAKAALACNFGVENGQPPTASIQRQPLRQSRRGATIWENWPFAAKPFFKLDANFHRMFDPVVSQLTRDEYEVIRVASVGYNRFAIVNLTKPLIEADLETVNPLWYQKWYDSADAATATLAQNFVECVISEWENKTEVRQAFEKFVKLLAVEAKTLAEKLRVVYIARYYAPSEYLEELRGPSTFDEIVRHTNDFNDVFMASLELSKKIRRLHFGDIEASSPPSTLLPLKPEPMLQLTFESQHQWTPSEVWHSSDLALVQDGREDLSTKRGPSKSLTPELSDLLKIVLQGENKIDFSKELSCNEESFLYQRRLEPNGELFDRVKHVLQNALPKHAEMGTTYNEVCDRVARTFQDLDIQQLHDKARVYFALQVCAPRKLFPENSRTFAKEMFIRVCGDLAFNALDNKLRELMRLVFSKQSSVTARVEVFVQNKRQKGMREAGKLIQNPVETRQGQGKRYKT